MRIAIDYTAAIAQHAGIGRYTRNLVSALAEVDTTDRLTLFSSELPTKDRGFPAAANIRSRALGIGNRNLTILWHRLRLPLPAELLTGSADVLHGPDFTLPPVLRARRVVTIHDLAFLTHPECALPSLVTYLTRVVPRAVHAADHIIAVSQRTADDLVAHLGVARERISVIHLGFDPSFSDPISPAQIEHVYTKYGLARPLVLAVGTLEPRKNYERLIAAFAQASREPGGPAMLVIAGRQGWLFEGIYRAVETYGVQNRVRFLDYVPDSELGALYRAADVVAMPSIYEGFGIPALEAMACGVPVVCSTAGSLPEVVGDAALLVTPDDIDALSEALLRVIRDPALRQSLASRGTQRVRTFSWKTAALAHLDVYRRVAGHT